MYQNFCIGLMLLGGFSFGWHIMDLVRLATGG